MIKPPKMTGWRKSPPGSVPVHPRTGAAVVQVDPTGGRGGMPMVVWGHSAVTSRLRDTSAAQFATESIFAAIIAAKKGTAESFVQGIAKMASKAVVGVFEEELRRAKIEAFEAGVKVGRAEMWARAKAAMAAGEAAATIFPKARHYVRKQDQAEGVALAEELQKYHGGLLADTEDTEDISPRPVRSISGWVQAAGLVRGMLVIQFRGGKAGPVVCVYPHGGGRYALESILSTPSAGRWVHAHVYASEYQLGHFK